VDGGAPPVYIRAFDPETEFYTTLSTASIPGNIQLPSIPTADRVSIEEIGGVGFAIELDSPIQSLTYYGSGGRSVTRTNVGTLRFSLGGLFKDQIPGAKNYIVPINSNLYKGLWNYFMLEADKSKGAHNPSFVMRVLAVTKAMLSQ
jgi:hypothetical protein